MAQDKPMITTIIPTYRRPHLLKRAINSILKQTHSNFQIRVYDNASGDETAEIMREFCHQDSRIHYFCHRENIGMMANYEYGFSRVNTPFFSFLSDDDYLMPWFYETALQTLHNYPEAAFAACAVLVINPKGEVVDDPLSGWCKEGYFQPLEGAMEMIKNRLKMPIPTGILFQSQIVNKISPDFSQEMQLMWDPDYLLQLAACFPIVTFRKICGLFITHEDGFSSGFYKNIINTPELLEVYIKATKKMVKRIEENLYLNSNAKESICNALTETMKQQIIWYMRLFMSLKKFKGAYYSARFFCRHHGNDKYIWFLLGPIVGYIYFPFLRPLIKAIPKLIKSVKGYKKPQILNHPTSQHQEHQNLVKEFLLLDENA